MNAPTKIIARADLIAAILAMDTLDAVDLIADAWEEVAAQATTLESDQIDAVMQSGNLVDTLDVLQGARANLKAWRAGEVEYDATDYDGVNEMRELAA